MEGGASPITHSVLGFWMQRALPKYLEVTHSFPSSRCFLEKSFLLSCAVGSLTQPLHSTSCWGRILPVSKGITYFFIITPGSATDGIYMSLDGRLVNFQIVLGSGSDSKETLCNVGDLDSIPGLGRSPGEGNGNQFQYSFLENSMDIGAWRATVCGITNSWTQLSD